MSHLVGDVTCRGCGNTPSVESYVEKQRHLICSSASLVLITRQANSDDEENLTVKIEESGCTSLSFGLWQRSAYFDLVGLVGTVTANTTRRLQRNEFSTTVSQVV